MSNKTLLIVEKSENVLNLIKESEDKYVLEGTFTEIGVKNNNNRIYDEKEILPHVNELKKLVEQNKLLGELDHPKSFDISLKNASHVIESIEYDKNTKTVVGRIRLLNTDAGKNARALVDAGVPLHISSRAAGVVESNGHVKIKKMFTYDLVANPGFSNAELKRVNESYGFEEDDNLGIFEVPSNWNFKDQDTFESFEDENNEPENKKINEMDSKKYISVEDFNQYTKIVKNEFENLKSMFEASKTSNDGKSINEGLIKYTETIAKKVNSLTEKFDRLTENVDGLISHNDYIIENLEKVKNYAELIGEKSNIGINYSEKLAESVDHLIEYTRLVAEKTDESIEYSKYVAEKTDAGIEYSRHIAEKADQGIEYTKHVAEKADQGIEYTKHVAEKADQNIEYSKYLAEKTNQGIAYTKMLAEKTNQVINYADLLSEKSNQIIDFNDYMSEENTNRWKYQTYINEQLDNVISHNDYIVEGTDSFIQYSNYLREQSENLSNYVDFVVKQINEGATTEEIAKNANALINTVDKAKQITKNIINESEDAFKTELSNKLTAILESAKNEKSEINDYHFFQFLGESKRKEFESFSEETKTKIVNAFNRNRYYGTADALRIWESCFIPEPKKLDWLVNMPSKYAASWNALTESQKNSIKAQASTKLLESQYQIDNFWATRDLRESKVDLVNENAIINESSKYESSNEYMDAVRAGFRNRFKR